MPTNFIQKASVFIIPNIFKNVTYFHFPNGRDRSRMVGTGPEWSGQVPNGPRKIGAGWDRPLNLLLLKYIGINPEYSG